MMYYIDKFFFKHPRKVNMTYTKHMLLSLNISHTFLKSSFKSFIHAIIPSLYETSASDCVKDISEKTKNRKE